MGQARTTNGRQQTAKTSTVHWDISGIQRESLADHVRNG